MVNAGQQSLTRASQFEQYCFFGYQYCQESPTVASNLPQFDQYLPIRPIFTIWPVFTNLTNIYQFDQYYQLLLQNFGTPKKRFSGFWHGVGDASHPKPGDATHYSPWVVMVTSRDRATEATEATEALVSCQASCKCQTCQMVKDGYVFEYYPL